MPETQVKTIYFLLYTTIPQYPTSQSCTLNTSATIFPISLKWSKTQKTFEAIWGQILLDFNYFPSVFYSRLSIPNLTVVCVYVCCCGYCFGLVWFIFIKSSENNLFFLKECSFCTKFSSIYVITLQIFSCNLFKYVWEQANQPLVSRQHNLWKKGPDVVWKCHWPLLTLQIGIRHTLYRESGECIN